MIASRIALAACLALAALARDAAASADAGDDARAASDDARDLAALASCDARAPYVAEWNAEQPLAWHCGHVDGRAPPDLAALMAAAPPLDLAVAARVRAIFADGAKKRSRANVFALVGDSMTLEPQFLTPFGAGAQLPVIVPDAVRDALRIMNGAPGETVIDVFRGVHAYGALDAFRAPRAARTGARVTWALEPDAATHETPIDAIVRQLSPAYAVILFGTNDADFLIEPLDRLATRFASALRALVLALEARGVVPILNTVPKHMRDPSLPDCSAHPGDRSNARLMIQATIASDVAAEVARERHLPLIDLRAALDPLLNHGISTDGVHPVFYPKRAITRGEGGGGGVLDEHGLACGVNARSFITLRMLAHVVAEIRKPNAAP